MVASKNDTAAAVATNLPESQPVSRQHVRLLHTTIEVVFSRGLFGKCSASQVFRQLFS